jgi:hypothetical protein
MEEPGRNRMETDRRTFVSTFGKAAIIAPPVVTALLSTSLSSPAIAASTGGDPTPSAVVNGHPSRPNGSPKPHHVTQKPFWNH